VCEKLNKPFPKAKEIWTELLGYHVGQKVRYAQDFWNGKRNLKGRKGVIKKIAYDSSNVFIIYYVKLNWIKGEFQLVKGEFEAV